MFRRRRATISTPEVLIGARGAVGGGSGVDKHAAAIARQQDGVVSAAQLAAAGMSRRAVAHRASTGRLERVHHGVYVLGPVRGPRWAEWAAALACGPRAVISLHSALAAYELGPRPSAGIVHVTRPTTGHRHAGVITHRARITDEDRTTIHGLPVTTPARTLLDLSPSMRSWELARLIEEALLRGLTSREDLRATLERNRGRAQASAFRAALAHDDEPQLTRSEAERRLLALIRASRLPAPQANARVGRYEVDFLWPEQRLVVEVDGFAFHSSRAAFERDRLRDAELQALGYRVLRITWRRLVAEPEAIVAQIAGLLTAATSA